jgi:gamma-glutamyl-gamma-aminobutyrate hydrolase PuuD
MAVQWHPERTFDGDEPSRKLFESFVEAARQWHAR